MCKRDKINVLDNFRHFSLINKHFCAILYLMCFMEKLTYISVLNNFMNFY